MGLRDVQLHLRRYSHGRSAANEIEAAINQIEAQRGKKIPDALATDLIASARFVLTRL